MRHVFSSLILFLSIVGALGAQGVIDKPGVGLIDGVQGLSFWPADPGKDSARDCTGCFVHLRPKNDPRAEIVLPCCEWQLPPRCNQVFLYWMEQGSEVSGQGGLITGSCEPGSAKRGSVLLASMGPAGTIRLAANHSLESEESFRAISTAGFTRMTYVSENAHQGMMLAVGDVIALLYSDKDGQEKILAVTEPHRLKTEEVLSLNPLPPSEGRGDLTVKLKGDPELLRKAVVSVIDASGKAHEPSFSAGRGTWFFHVFYRIAPGPITIRVGGGAWADPLSISVKSGEVAQAEIPIQALPKLDVLYSVPDALCKKLTVLVSDFVSGKVVDQRTVQDPQGLEIFENCPAGPVSAQLNCDSRVYQVVEDLSDGQGRTVRLEPPYYTIRGTLFEGDEPAKGTLQFSGVSEWIETGTEDDGSYSCMMFNPTDTVRARTDDANDWRFFSLSPPITEDTKKDVFLSGGKATVEVLDSGTNEAISGAIVRYHVKDENGSQSGRRSTGADGKVRLPPVVEGEVHLKVLADGYRDDELTFSSLGDGQDEFVVYLDPEEARAFLELSLASGAPAAKATVVLSDRPGGTGVWKGLTGQDGRVALPDVHASLLFAYHPQSGVFAQQLQWPNPGESIRIGLPSLAPPIVVKFVDEQGTPVPGASYLLSVNGWTLNRILRGQLAMDAFPMMADGYGLLRLKDLPSLSIGILGWAQHDMAATRDAYMGYFDSDFSPISSSPAGVVNVEIIRSGR